MWGFAFECIMWKMLCFNLCYGLNIWGAGKGMGVTLYKSVHVICRHLIDNAKIVKIFKSKITKSPIASQWAIRTHKKVYILKD